MKNTNKGLIHVYTGDGKGKTTSAVGLSTRALGNGLKVCYASFHKRPEVYGYNEINSLEKLNAKILIFAKGHPHLDKSLDTNVIKKETDEAIKTLSQLINNEDFDMLIMDEVLISVRDGFLPEEKLLQFIKNKPKKLELILTGRGATIKIIGLADYVSEIKKIKHPYDKGIKSRKGIEF
jgi:cob(I)alamin adenosyltransferase